METTAALEYNNLYAMDTNQNKELDKYLQLKLKSIHLKTAIQFLRKCIRNKLVPDFAKIKVKGNTKEAKTTEKYARSFRIKQELKSKYTELEKIDLETYDTHIKLLSTYYSENLSYQIFWQEYNNYVNSRIAHKYRTINSIHNKKIWKLKSKQPRKPKRNVSTVPNFVQNLSSEVFSEKEMNILNKGLKFAPKPTFSPNEDIVANLESGISKLSMQEKQSIRYQTKKILVYNNSNNRVSINSKNHKNACAKLLKNKNVTYIKADKGNSVVILDKTDYDNRVLKMIEEGPYEEYKFKNGNTRNPLPQMIRSAKDVIKTIGINLKIPYFHFKMNMPNPRVPFLYALPKIHKQGSKMRPIVSNISTPTQKLSGWLINELNRLDQPVGKYVKNTIEFVEKIKDLTISDEEIMVSFDVTALYPNVPVDIAIKCMIDHAKQQRVPDRNIELYQKVAEVCMNQNFFQFRGKMYKQTFGTCMGSKIAPYLSNLFMCNFEEKISSSPLFPRIWLRYVDDVFALIKKDDLQMILDMLNSQYPTIKFTSETESDGTLPFLDVKVMRINNKFEFGIYRKPTNTMRFITSDSHHNGSNKKAAFHSLAHRLYNIPMSTTEFETEITYIKETAKVNGYDPGFIKSILDKHSRKQQIRAHTTLLSISEPSTKYRLCVPFYPKITNKLGNILKQFNIKLVTKSTNLGELICNYKDVPPPSSKSGIYKICCTSCDEVYIGQTARPFEKRLQEHSMASKNKESNKSSVAEHMVNNTDHRIDSTNSKIIKFVRDNWKLDAYESLLMDRYRDKLMNTDAGPIQSNLFNVVNNFLTQTP